MTFNINDDCIACAACEGVCPEVFRVVEDKSTVILNPVPEELKKCALAAEDGCPVEAISHE